jgi:hypothetical protein
MSSQADGIRFEGQAAKEFVLCERIANMPVPFVPSHAVKCSDCGESVYLAVGNVFYEPLCTVCASRLICEQLSTAYDALDKEFAGTGTLGMK